MKAQNIYRMQVIAIGFGAALLLSSSAKSQEIVNTEFSDGPYVTAFAQPSSTEGAQAAATLATSPAATTDSLSVAIATPVVSDAELSSLAGSTEGWLISCAIFGMALVVVYAVGEIRRANRNLTARRPFPRRVAFS
jgi:hypothetical protein